MSRLHRKLAVRSTTQGLIIRPFDSTARGPYRGSAVLVKWKSNAPTQLSDWQEEKESDETLLVVDGIAGLLQGFAGESLLLMITSEDAVLTYENSR